MGAIPRRLALIAVLLILVAGSAATPSRAVGPVVPSRAIRPAAPAAAVNPTAALNPAASATANAPPGTAAAYGTKYEPLRPGTRLTYRLCDGANFTREVMLPVTIPWFDGTLRQVIPVFDSRYGGYFLYSRQGDEIQVIGTWHDGELSRWGEYILVVDHDASPAAPIDTPSQRFEAVQQMMADGGPAWYAEGVGLVKTNEFALTAHEHVEPRQSGL